MATTLNFKDVIDLPEFRPIANAPAVNALSTCLAQDLRNNEDRHPEIFMLGSLTTLYKYNFKNDGWITLASPALAGTFVGGAAAQLMPSCGPNGTLAAGWSTTKGALTTALPAGVATNALANRGDGLQGFKIRIIGNSAGGSGKTEERYIVANTSGTTPTITLDSALSFTPASGDRYEILAGRVFLLASGAVSAGVWKYYDIATNSFSGNLNTTNLTTGTTDASMVGLDELHTPTNRAPGEGIFGIMTATATSGTTITGTGAAADASRLANEFNNFQVRIVEDTGTPTAVGQRRRISANTAATPTVYTVATWGVTPSATAKYVIEYNNDILLWRSAATTTFSYAAGGNAADASWSTTAYAVRPAVEAVGTKSWHAHAITPDASTNARYSYIYSTRGGAVATIDLFDFASGSTGTWSSAIAYANSGDTFTTGTAVAYDPVTNQGRYAYINRSGTQTVYRFDCLNQVLEAWAQLRYTQGTPVAGSNMATASFIDGTTKLGSIIIGRQANVEFFQVMAQR